jgi:hypothetical protein
MFGHGQIEGFEEKYGMEYRRSYRDEKPDQYLVDRHEREIFPLLKRRYLFSGSVNFTLYDLAGSDGKINENVFAYSNKARGEMALVCYNNVYTRASGWIKNSSVAIPQKDGTKRQNSLSQALGLHGESRCFAVMHEHRSDLWYIRSSKELTERGLFVGLNGYEAQIFMDIREVADVADAVAGSWDGRWARLNYELNGRGVKDLDAALLDIFLGELYAPLDAIFKSERLDQLTRFFVEESDAAKETIKATGITAGVGSPVGLEPDALKSPVNGGEEELRNREAKRLEFIDYFKEPVFAFMRAGQKYLPGIKGGYKALERERELPPLAIDVAWKRFSLFLERLVRLAEMPEGDLLREHPQGAILVFGFGVLSLLRAVLGEGASGSEAAKLAAHWMIPRKLCEGWEGAGIPASEARSASHLALAVLARTAPETAFLPAELNASQIAELLIAESYDDEDFRTLIGVNRFNDVTWFRKEAFEDTVNTAAILLLPESAAAFGGDLKVDDDRAWLKRLLLIKNCVVALHKAEETSGYKLDALLSALSVLAEKAGKRK